MLVLQIALYKTNLLLKESMIHTNNAQGFIRL